MMKKTRTAIVRLFVGALSLLITSCVSETMHVHIKQESISPDGSTIATFYSFGGGGGATGHSFQSVSLRARDEPFAINAADVLGLDRAYEVRFRWRNVQHLVIEYPHDAGVRSKRAATGSVKVTFAPKPSKDGFFQTITNKPRRARDKDGTVTAK